MIVILSNNKYMYKTVLPEKVAGRYWLKDDFNGRMRNLICVEASNGKWIAKSNKNATFYNYDNETVDSVEIINGMAHILKTREDEKTLLFADTYTSSGSEFVRYYIPVNTDITIGRETGNTIVYNNKFVSANHTIIRRNNDVWTIQDNNSTNGTYVNNTRIGLDTLVPGDTIYIMGLRIIIGNDFISINNPNKNVVCDENVLKKMFESETKLFLIKDDESETDNFFYRSPRLTSRIDTLKFRVSPPIAQQDTEKTPMAMMIGPSLTMGMGSASTAAFSVINAVGRNASISSIAPTLIMAVAMMSGTVLWPTITKKYEKRQKSRLENKRQSKYREYLTETKDRIIKAIREQSEILQSNNVSLTECEDIIMLAKRNLWERTIGQDDFLEVRIGIGDKPLDAEIDFPERGFTIEEDNLWDDLQALSNTPRILKNVPITYSLIKNSVSGIVGKDLNIVYDFIKCLVIRIASDYSYDEVKIMVIADSDDQNNWDYIKWIPHIWDNSKNMRFFVSNENDANEMFAYIDKIIEGYNNADRETEIGQYYIIFNASKELTKKSETMKKIYTDGEQYGFSVFCITDEIRNLPKECSEIIEISENESKIYDKHDISGNCQSFKADTKLVHSINSLVRKLSGIKLDLSSTSEVLPSMLTFLEMYNVSKIEHLNIRTRWKENNPTVTLKAPVGVDTLGNLFYLDLHEKYQGPHGLVAGMTGSGKSEFIITYILSMAVNYHPDEVAFILIDYKGGGLAGAFENKKKGIKLPHLAGTITNLDGASINRSLVSIQSELRKRQSIFNEVKYKISQNFGKQYVLQMNDKSDYSSVFGNVKGVYPSKLIGRGLILKNSVYEFQTAHICKDEELQAYVTGLTSELNANYSDDNVIKVPEVPEKLTPEDIKITQTLENVQIGVDLDLVKPVVVNLKKSVVNVITGKNIDEVIATGRGIAELVSRIDNCEVTILDSETEESKIVEIYNMMVERNNSYKDDNTLTFDRKVIFIMNWQSIIDNLSTDGKDKLECLIKHCELEYSVTFILCDIAESVKKYNRSNWYVMRADSSDYVWVGMGIDEQSVFNNPINYREVKKVKKDNAVVVSSDEYIIIKPVRQYEKVKGV